MLLGLHMSSGRGCASFVLGFHIVRSVVYLRFGVLFLERSGLDFGSVGLYVVPSGFHLVSIGLYPVRRWVCIGLVGSYLVRLGLSIGSVELYLVQAGLYLVFLWL